MNYGKATEKLMGMTDAVWERHTNPWSGWSRVAVLPLLTLAVWSRIWVDWWALAPIVALLLWVWLNPRVFPVPASTENWMSKGVLGERIWLARKDQPTPDHHTRMAHLLSLCGVLGFIPYVWGLITLDFWMTVAGLAIVMLGKLWFLDRMVWLYEATERP